MNKNDGKIIKLDNGLRVFLYSDKSKVCNFVDLITMFGGHSLIENDIDIKEVIPGTAHLLEHVICECSCDGNLIKELEKNKALNANGCTNYFMTRYYFNTVYNLDELLVKFLDIIYNPSFDEDKLNKTKIPVYNEIRDSKNKEDLDIIIEKNKALFGEYKTTLGEKEDIDKIDSKYLKLIYDSAYVPENQLLVVAGNFDEDKILSIIKERYDSYKFNPSKKFTLRDTGSKIFKNEVVINKDELNKVIISYKFDISNMIPEEKYKLDWYLSYFIDLNFSEYSPLNIELQNENIIYNNIYTNYYMENNSIILEIKAYVKDKDKFIDKVDNTINNFNNTSEDINLMIKSSKTRMAVRKDNIGEYIFPIIDNIIKFNYEYIDNISFIDTLNIDEYNEYIKKLNFSNRCIIYVGNFK